MCVPVGLVHEHADAVGVVGGDPGAAGDGEALGRRVDGRRGGTLPPPTAEGGAQHARGHAAEAPADEAVEEEVDSGVEQRQHVGEVGEQVQGARRLRGDRRRGVQVVEDDGGARRPECGERRRDDQQDGRGLARGVAAEAEAVASPAELVDDGGVEGEEDGAGEQVHGPAVSPHQHVLPHTRGRQRDRERE